MCWQAVDIVITIIVIIIVFITIIIFITIRMPDISSGMAPSRWKSTMSARMGGMKRRKVAQKTLETILKRTSCKDDVTD